MENVQKDCNYYWVILSFYLEYYFTYFIQKIQERKRKSINDLDIL